MSNGDAIQRIFDVAKKNRMVAATNCNERSSRSHSVFILKIAGQNRITSEACIGTLNLVSSSLHLGPNNPLLKAFVCFKAKVPKLPEI